MRPTGISIGQEETVGTAGIGAQRDRIAAVVAVALAAALLLLATTQDGAFALRWWGPPAIVVLAILAALVAAGGGTAPRDRRLVLALIAAWAFAAWAALSTLWAASPADAWESAARIALYAGVLTLPLVVLRAPRDLAALGYGVVAGIGVIAVVTLIALLVDGESWFLAGRLDAPVGYRNATACLFSLAVWPAISLAAIHGRARLLRAGAFALAILCLGLAFLTQSRGMVVGLAAGGAVAVALGPDRLRRVWLAIAAAGGIAAVSGPLLAPYDAFDVGRGVASESDISEAGFALLIPMAVGFVAAFLLAVYDSGLHRVVRRAGRPAAVALAVVVTGAAVAGVAAVGNPVAYASDRWEEFRDIESNPTGSTRLTSTGGQRYDLWRVAVNEFADHPIAGVGGGSFRFDYYRERRTDRNLTDPHGAVFSVMSQYGLVGLALMLAFLAAVVASVALAARRVGLDERRSAAGLLAGGAVLLGQLSVDWIYLIPGVTAVGVLLLAAGLGHLVRSAEAQPASGGDGAGRPPTGRIAARAALAGGLAAATVAVALLYLADAEVRVARTDLADDPPAALERARDAAALNPLSATPHYLQASALESLGRPGEALAALREAREQEPDNFVAIALLGDFAARRGRFEAAAALYRRALEFNPRDVGLQELARTGGRPQADQL